MSKSSPTGIAQPKSDPGKITKNADATAVIKLPPGAGAVVPPTGEKEANTLTPDEQMALYEKELKEKDWGHQPC